MLILVIKCSIFHHNNVISADSIAISVPVHIAIQTSACDNATASFIPSQTIATLNPFSCSSFIFFAFSLGKTSAIISSIQASFAIGKALSFLSHVKIAVFIPDLCNSSIKLFAEDLITSAIQIVQSNSSPLPKNTGVCHNLTSCLSHFAISSPSPVKGEGFRMRFINFLFPAQYFIQSISHSTPIHSTFLNFLTSKVSVLCFKIPLVPFIKGIFKLSAFLIIASANG
ncbi:MAG: hypothetical protein LBC61_01055 [Candidatus Peribacteria bacterium]|jgi:hypothetical protein|nr:hypothetical protein [Candidatus Peribacteria bacterium]